jgi:hypothetical protein
LKKDGEFIPVSGGGSGGGSFDGEHVPTGDPTDPAMFEALDVGQLLYDGVEGGGGGDAGPHDHDYLPLAGGTLTGDLAANGQIGTYYVGSEANPSIWFAQSDKTGFYALNDQLTATLGGEWSMAWTPTATHVNKNLQVGGTVATSNPGSEGAPAFTSTLYPTTGMYGHADGVFFAVDGHWKFGAWADRVGIRHDLQVDGSITAAGGTLTSVVKITQPGEALRLLAPLSGGYGSYVAIYHGDTRAGYFGYPSAPSGGETIVHGDSNTLALGSYVSVKVAAPSLQVDGQLNFGAHAAGPIINLFHNPDGSNKYGFGLNTNLVAFWAGGKQVGGFDSVGNLYLDGTVRATRGVAFSIATGINTADVLDRAETATMPVLDDEGVATADADVDVLTVNEVVTALLLKVKEQREQIAILSADIQELKGN